eukprot:4149865-Pyramimonas_sp.AAC.1
MTGLVGDDAFLLLSAVRGPPPSSEQVLEQHGPDGHDSNGVWAPHSAHVAVSAPPPPPLHALFGVQFFLASHVRRGACSKKTGVYACGVLLYFSWYYIGCMYMYCAALLVDVVDYDGA